MNMKRIDENWGLGDLPVTDCPIAAFDCDGTLWEPGAGDGCDVPVEKNVALLKSLKAWGFRIVVWSGGGKDHAERCVRRCGLEGFADRVCSKTEAREVNADIAFDDMRVNLAKVNIKV